MKKIFILLLLTFCIGLSFAAVFENPSMPVSSRKLMDKSWWGYDGLMTLAIETGQVFFVQDAPLSVAEIKRYMQEINYEKLSESGKKIYDDILYDFYQSGLVLKSDAIKLGVGVAVTPELYFKSNENIDWSFKYNLKDDILAAPVTFGVADIFLIESDIFFGKNYWAMQDAKNFINIPLGYDEMEFFWPRKSYISAGFEIAGTECFNFSLGRMPLSFGMTQLGSLILSEHYENDAFAQVSFFSPDLKYSLTTIQSDVNRYFYLHRIQARFFKRFQFGAVEGTFVNAPFEFRFLNPLCIMHSFKPNHSYDGYNEGQANGDAKDYKGHSRVCSYFAADFNLSITDNFRLYGLYAQNEYQGKGELTDGLDRGNMYPDSLGYQLGLDVKMPSKTGGYWFGAIEGVYTTPWLYIKQDADCSLYETRYDNLKNQHLPICSWVGVPFGPDSIAAQGKIGYQYGRQWSLEFQYMFLVQGENSFNLFYNEDGSSTANSDGKYTYYPVTGYDTGNLTAEEAIKLARNTPTPTGIPMFTNRITVSGSYWFKKMVEFSALASYVFVYNNDHVTGNFQQGMEFALSAKVSFLR